MVFAGEFVVLNEGCKYWFRQLDRYRIMKVIHSNEARGVLNSTRLALLLCLLSMSFSRAVAQAEVEPWGNMNGIRVDGQLMAFSSSLRVIGTDGTILNATAKEKQNPEGRVQQV